jgi:hypothetical protein
MLRKKKSFAPLQPCVFFAAGFLLAATIAIVLRPAFKPTAGVQVGG